MQEICENHSYHIILLRYDVWSRYLPIILLNKTYPNWNKSIHIGHILILICRRPSSAIKNSTAVILVTRCTVGQNRGSCYTRPSVINLDHFKHCFLLQVSWILIFKHILVLWKSQKKFFGSFRGNFSWLKCRSRDIQFEFLLTIIVEYV